MREFLVNTILIIIIIIVITTTIIIISIISDLKQFGNDHRFITWRQIKTKKSLQCVQNNQQCRWQSVPPVVWRKLDNLLMDLEYSTSSLIHCSGTWPTFVVLLQSFVGLNSSSSPQNEWKQLKMTANFQSVQILQSLFTFNYINCCCHSESNCDLKENSQKVFSRIRERICRRICLRQSQRPNLRFYWNNLKKLLQVITIDINNLRFNWNNHRKT